MSDSEKNTASTASTPSQDNLSLLAEFDELLEMRNLIMDRNNNDTMEFINFVAQTGEMLNDFILLKEENQRLHNSLEEKTQQLNDMEARLKMAQKLFDRERRERRKIEDLPNNLKSQIVHVREINKLIQEVETTGFNSTYTKSEDDLDASFLNNGKTWKTHRPSVDGVAIETAIKKMRTSTSKVVETGSSDEVTATTTTVTVENDGPPLNLVSLTAKSFLRKKKFESYFKSPPH